MKITYSDAVRLALSAGCWLWAGPSHSEILYFQYSALTRIEPKQVCFTARNGDDPRAAAPTPAQAVKNHQPAVCLVRAQIAVGHDVQHPFRGLEATKLVTYGFGVVQEACLDAHWQLAADELAADLSGISFRCMPSSEYEIYAAKARPSSVRSTEAISYLKDATISHQLGWPQLRPF